MLTINVLTCDVIEKCLLSTFVRVVLSGGEIQNLLRLDWDKAVYRQLLTLGNFLLTAKTFFKIILYLSFN